jgi:hypothetical protein
MTRKIPRFFLVLIAVTGLAAAQTSEPSVAQPPASQEHSTRSLPEPKNVRSDIEKMRILLGQMQRNVAFVSPGDSPLKHQFELEIDMWQLLLEDLDKTSSANSGKKTE